MLLNYPLFTIHFRSWRSYVRRIARTPQSQDHLLSSPWRHPQAHPHDIAASLAGAPQNAQRTALAAFAGFPEPLLPGLVEARLWRLADAEGWYAPPERVRRIAKLAVWEYCEPPRCGECEGRMIVYTPPAKGMLGLPSNAGIGGQAQPGKCEACNGSGYGRIRASQLCDVLGVSLGEWQGVWRYRYDRAYGIVAGWGADALRHLHRRLGDEVDSG